MPPEKILHQYRYAKIGWTAGDVMGQAEELGIPMDRSKAELFLALNSRTIQDVTVARGWEAIETLLRESS